MDVASHIEHLRRDGATLLDACRAEPGAPVPTCPPWDRVALLRHVAGVHSWHRAQVERGPAARVRFSERPPEPASDDELPVWFEENLAGLVAALGAMDTTTTWPTWAGDQPASWFPRRMAQETAVHRWDGAGGDLDPALAVDGVDEHLELFAPMAPGAALDAHGTVHLHATDADGEWLVTLSAEGVRFEHGHAKGDVALRGRAGDLLLWTWNRVPVDGRFEVFGDPALLDAWRAGVAI